MKNLVFYSLFFTFFFLYSKTTNGQCQLAIPSNAQIIQTNEPMFMGGSKKAPKVFWVCNNATLKLGARNAIVFLETGSTLILTGGKVKLYARRGSTTRVSGFASCDAFYEPGTNISKIQSSALIKYNQRCDKLEFDFSNAPKGICPRVNPSEVVVVNPPSPPTPPNNNSTDDNNNHTNPPVNTDDPYGHLTDTIPSNAQVVSEQYASSSQRAVYWLCKNAKLTHTGSNSTFYLEPNATLILNGSNNIVYLKSSSNLEIKAGAKNQIQYEEGANLINDRGMRTKFLKIPNLQYNYEQAPASGCK